MPSRSWEVCKGKCVSVEVEAGATVCSGAKVAGVTKRFLTKPGTSADRKLVIAPDARGKARSDARGNISG